MHKLINKKGQIGLDYIKGVMLIFLVMSVLAIVILIAFSQLTDVSDTINPRLTGTITNETVYSVNYTNIALSINNLRLCSLSNVIVTNRSDAKRLITSPNYTTSGCHIQALTAGASYNASDWNVSATYSYDNNRISGLANNISSGTVGFFGNTGTIFAILVVVVIIAAIALIIAYTMRFGGSGTETG